MVKKVGSLTTWLNERAAGVFLHISSLPSHQGIGCLGEGARHWIDFLSESGFRYWQVCPLGPTGFGDSPYQTFSSFAGNPYFIDLDDLVRIEYLHEEDILSLKTLSREYVDYGQLYTQFLPKLQRAFERFLDVKHDGHPSFLRFCEEQSFWLPIYSLFMALKETFHGQPFEQWPERFGNPKNIADLLAEASLKKSDKLYSLQKKHCFIQYLFHQQWQGLLKYAHAKGIFIIGDVPIFPGRDSADFWGYRSIFQTDKNGKIRYVAGVPPDAFSAEGQFWGNPIFNWEELKKTHHHWWIQRLQQAKWSFDVIRLDHFRGFHDYWAIPAGAKNARQGRWRRGPGISFFHEIAKKVPDLKCIAEDLGALSPGVHQLLKASQLPGMRILQFAFNGDPQNPYLPHMHEKNSVLYLGTHDNDTTIGWYAKLSAEAQDHVRRYFQSDGSAMAWDIIRQAYVSPCRLLILTLQDLLSLDSRARFNTPSTQQNNWTWRYTAEQLQTLKIHSSDYLKKLSDTYGRNRSQV
ncbi:MAG: 4-alpha-glucanotransferase [Puniceicoccales bacterium]|jgi:4-alpha-glucanotransferase|nr:4-alpha-glucanotransferase [Puniceicoccales bacterium]